MVTSVGQNISKVNILSDTFFIFVCFLEYGTAAYHNSCKRLVGTDRPNDKIHIGV